MEMNSKQLLALAAIGAAVWYFMKKGGTGTSVTAATKPAIAPAAGTGGIWDGFGVGGSLSEAMGQTPATTNPATTPDAVYTGQNKPLAVAPAESPAPSSGAVFGGGSNQSSSSQLGGGLNSKGEWVYPDGSVYRGPSVSGDQAMSVMGY